MKQYGPKVIALHVCFSSLMIFMIGCGTEIGNGWKADDGVSGKDRKTDSSGEPLANQDAKNDLEEGSVSDSVSAGNGDDSDGDSLVIGDSQYEIGLLFAECASPFGDSIAEVDYLIGESKKNNQGFLVLWEAGSWTFFGDDSQGSPHTIITPDQQSSTIEVFSPGEDVAKSSGIICSDVHENENASIEDDSSYRSVKVTLTLPSGLERDLQWYVNKDTSRLTRIEIQSDDLEPVVITIFEVDE